MPPSRIPGTVTAAAIILMVYGGLQLVCGVCSGGFLVMPETPDARAMNKMLQEDAPGHQIAQYGGLAAHLLTGVVMLVAGLGVLRLSNPARIVAYLVGIADIVLTTAAAIYTMFVISPVQQRFIMDKMKAGPAVPAGLDMIMQGSTIFGVIVAIAIPLAFCIPYMILLTTASARAAFSGQLPLDMPSEQEERRRPYGGYDDDDYNPPPREPKNPGDTGITDRPV